MTTDHTPYPVAHPDDIKPSPTNPRQDFTGIEEFAEGLKQVGILQPIVVRTNPTGAQDGIALEIICGERRWRGAKIAGLSAIPYVLRDDLTDQQIIEVQLIENLKRRDLNPLEEARGYRTLMDEHKVTADALAESIGRSRSYIFSTLKLMQLCEEGQRLMLAGALNPSTALLIARIPTDDLQKKAIADVTRTDWNGDPLSVRAAARLIRDRYMTSLAAVAWPLDDATLLPAAGACTACPHRTGNNPDLFADCDSANVCTNPECFADKRAAEAERRLAASPESRILTGDEAYRAMPGYASETRTHAKLDSVCGDDPQKRTYREILGERKDGIDIVQRGETMVETVQKKVIRQILNDQGVTTAEQKQRESNKKLKQEIELSRAWRARLFSKVRELASMEVKEEGPLPLMKDVMPILAHKLMTDIGQGHGGTVAGLWGAIGENDYTRWQAYRLALPTMSAADLLLVCLDCALVKETDADEYNYRNDPEFLLTIARALEIDPAAEMKAVKDEAKAAADTKAEKAAKKGKKTAPPAPSTAGIATPPDSASTPTPSQAAPAPDLFADADAKAPADTTPAALASDNTGEDNKVEKNEEPIVAEPTASDTTATEAQPQHPIETKQKNHPAGDPFSDGAAVMVKEDAKGPNGMKRKCAGKSGNIKRLVASAATPGDEWYAVSIGEKGTHINLQGKELTPVVAAKVEGQAKASSPAKKSASKPTIEYRHPDHKDLEWTGRGRKPKWVEDALSAGMTLDDLKVNK